MLRCLQLAKNGLGTTYPNPLVGSVIVHNQKIIGEGWHYQAGQPHAEVLAIRSVKKPSLLPKSTLYVNLEPCSHFGKTPPCSDLIIQKGIKHIVIGTVDPFAEVSGNGIQKLLMAGCKVKVGIMEEECRELNKRFFTFHQKQRPYIILKWAETSDGFIAPVSKKDRTPVWITNSYSRQGVHRWRTEEQAILVGNQTVIDDNPCLTARDWKGNNPVRVILDLSDKLSGDHSIFDPEAKTIVVTHTTSNKSDFENVVYEKISEKKPSVQTICSILYRYNIQSIIIEGGQKTLQSFIDASVWDEARVFKSHAFLKEGINAPVLRQEFSKNSSFLQDNLSIYIHD